MSIHAGRRGLFLAGLAGAGAVVSLNPEAASAAVKKPKLRPAATAPTEFSDVKIGNTLQVGGTDQYASPILTIETFEVDGVYAGGGASLGLIPPSFHFGTNGTQIVGPSAAPADPGGNDDAGTGTGLDVTATSPSSAIVATQRQGYGRNSVPGVPIRTGEALTAAGPNAVISATQTDTGSSSDAVTVAVAGLGRALVAIVSNARNTNAPVTVRNSGTGPAVYASSTNTNNASAAIEGINSGSGKGSGGYFSGNVGGEFAGKRAQINMQPSTAATHPTSGTAGDLFVDRTARLWFCKGGRNWKEIA